MKRFLINRITDRLIALGFEQLVRAFVFSTKFGKQTYSKRAIQTVWKASHHR